jgi:TRAP-type C4-dicarboxylate transport system permease small subunit
MDAILRLMAGYALLLRAIGRIEQVLGVALIALIVTTISTQVFTRYALNRPIIWVEELATYSFIWGAFLGASLGWKRGRHIFIETIGAYLHPRLAALLRLAAHGLILALLLTLVQLAPTIITVESRSQTVSLPIALPRALFYSVPLFVCAVSMALTSVYFVLAELLRLVRAEGGDTLRGIDVTQAGLR